MTALIAAACRSPVAPRGGALADLSLHGLGAPVVAAVLAQAGVAPQEVDELILSNALGAGGNPARAVALAAGLPETVAGLSVDRQCAGGLDALLLARQMVLSGDADIVVAGGVESYSRRPERWRTYADGRPAEQYAQASFTPWPDRDPDMAEAADALGHALGIDRAAQDDWAVNSHAKALVASGALAEIVPLGGLTGDSFARRLTLSLCRRAPVLTGSISAANAAVAADGAAFCLVVSPRVAARLKGPLVEITGGATLGGTPELPGLAPVAAIRKTLARAGLVPHALHSVDIMEAYAVQAIACVQGAGIDPARVNRWGGALARGHPIGASGAVGAVRLFHQIKGSGGAGLAAIAAAGGIGTAVLLTA